MRGVLEDPAAALAFAQVKRDRQLVVAHLRDVEDAARVLGACWGGTFLRVTLPLSMPGILSGSILVFVLTISALVTPRLLGRPTYQVMSTLIFDEFLHRLNWPAGSAPRSSKATGCIRPPTLLR